MIGMILGTIFVVITLIAYISFSRLAKARNTVDLAWQRIIVEFENRRSMMPLFIELLRTASDEEAENISATAKLRRHESSDDAMSAVKSYENSVTHEFKNLIHLIVSHPELKTARDFRDLFGRLTDIEIRIDDARMHYNDAVRTYNALRIKFPMSLFTQSLSYAPENSLDVNYVTDSKTIHG